MKTIATTLVVLSNSIDAHAHVPDAGTGIATQFSHALFATHHLLPALATALVAAAIVLLQRRSARRWLRGRTNADRP